MYSPVPDGMDRTAQSVRYTEAKPPPELSSVVHCFWELKTEERLLEDFSLHAVPDACVNILFNQLDTDIAGVTALRTTFEVLDLGKSFHYVGMQLLPGVWQGDRREIADRFVGTPYSGDLPLVAASKEIAALDFVGKQAVLAELVKWLVTERLIVANPVVARILADIERIRSVADMATAVELSPRQLQRTLKRTTGLSPHDLLKVLRFQQSFKRHYLDLYADQSHYIHAFRKVTGYTPVRYSRKFDV
jgi:AraC-like DNA-binding protein